MDKIIDRINNENQNGSLTAVLVFLVGAVAFALIALTIYGQYKALSG